MPDPLTDPLALELARLAPAKTAVTPASVLFAAGVQSAEAKANRWKMATASLVVLFVGSWVGMTLQQERANRPDAGSVNREYAEQTVKPVAPAPVRPAPPSGDAAVSPPKPIPQLIAFEVLDDEALDRRIKGIRLRNDILAGGLGMIPDQSRYERPYVPNGSSMEMNKTVLGGHYAPKKADPKPNPENPD